MIPPKYEDANFEDIPIQLKELFKAIKQTRRGIYIHGPFGTGKTNIVYAMKKEWESGGGTVIFWNTIDLLQSIKSDFDKKIEDKEMAEQRIENSRGLLILDDIGTEKMTEHVRTTFYQIINHRYNHRLPVVYTSNYPLSEMAEKIGEGTVSRIVEMSDIVELVGEDRRMENINKIKIEI